MSGRPPDQLAREVKDTLVKFANTPSKYARRERALAALAELQAQAEAGQREADIQLGEKLAAQMTLKAVCDVLNLPMVSLGNGWTEATPKIIARIETIVDEAERAFRERDAALAAAAPSPADHATTQFQWLIERGQPEEFTNAEWLENSGEYPATRRRWTRDAWRAAMFPDRETAEAYIAAEKIEARAVEHGFAAAPSPADRDCDEACREEGHCSGYCAGDGEPRGA